MSSQPLRVALDISAMPYGRGVSRYTSNLVEALAAQPGVRLTLFGAVGKEWLRLRQWASELRGQPAYRVLPISSTWLDHLWRLFRLPSMSLIEPLADVVHVWEWQQPPLTTQPWVVTIHDLAHMLFPETAHPEVVERYARLIHSIEKDQRVKVIAVSSSTKNDIVRLTSIDPERITVVLEALPVEAKYTPSQQEVSATLKKHKLSKPYFLFVGTSEPRKNLSRVIEAWQQKSQSLGYELVLAGAAGWDNLPDHPGIRQLGYVKPEELSSLYRGATGLLFPTLYEGFGLPVLEAFFHGCPVVTSRISSLPEVAGDAAILVDPYTPEGIAEGIHALLNLSMDDKQRLQKKMTQQLNKFSWDTAAEQTIAVYRQASQTHQEKQVGKAARG